MQIVLAIIMAFVTIEAKAIESLPCVPHGDCSDPCIYFRKNVVFIDNYKNAKLNLKGRIHDLSLKSRKEIIKKQADAELVGDTTVAVYSDNSVSVTFTSKILDTSCYYNKSGKYVPTESCCNGQSKVQLEVTTKYKKEVYKTIQDWGC